MSDEDALLAAIIADPDEDTPRLVYADWLDENGQEERAEFIRLQIARRCTMRDCSAKLFPFLVHYPDEWTRFGREAELLARNWDAWAEPFRPWTHGSLFFHRGFVEELTCGAAALVDNHLPLFQMKAPLSTIQITLSGSRDYLAELLSISHPPACRLQLKGYHPDQSEIDLLPPNPPGLEPHLRRGSWLVLVVRTDRETELETARRLHSVSKTRRCAVRKYGDEAGFSAWCPALHNSLSTPRWVWLEDGRMVRHNGSTAVPNPM